MINKIARLEMVIATEIRQTKTSLAGKDDGVKFTNKLYNLTYVDTLNSDFTLTKIKIVVDWDKTATYYKDKVKKYDEWISYMIPRKEDECASLKYEIGFGESENYTKAIKAGRTLRDGYNDYIETVEGQIKALKLIESIEDVEFIEEIPNRDEEIKAQLRIGIKALGGKSQGLKTVEKLQSKLNSLKQEQEESTED